jgi:hypothetical protein
MEKLAKEIVTIILDQYGVDRLLERISDPFWFQAFGCVLGYDWHSSGVTTVVTGVLKRAIVPEESGIAVCGGKGKAARKTPDEIEEIGEKFGFSDESIRNLQYASRMSAKVDNAAVQAGYQLYHHAFIVTEQRKWTVVQQGMCAEDRTARRYHWLSDKVAAFTVEPHNAIVGDAKRESALNMTAIESEGCRKASVDIAKEPTEKTARMVAPSHLNHQRLLQEWLPSDNECKHRARGSEYLMMPLSINCKALRKVYEFQPSNYEELLAFKGVGPATVRGLALIAELVYGEKPSWKDPVKYSFAYGGKDGVPYPVNRKAMDESVQMLRRAVEESRIGDREKMHSLCSLRKFVPEDRENESS